MASSIHMSHNLFCFVFIENEDIALSSDISNELCHNNYFCLHKTIMVTRSQDIFCKTASSGENISSSTFTCRNEECCKFFTNVSNHQRHEERKVFYCCLCPCLSLDVCLQSTVCLYVCLSVCLSMQGSVIPNIQYPIF